VVLSLHRGHILFIYTALRETIVFIGLLRMKKEKNSLDYCNAVASLLIMEQLVALVDKRRVVRFKILH